MRKKLTALLMAAVMVLSCGTIAFAEEYNTVTAAETVQAAKEGTAHILDVRLWEKYTAGRLQDSDWSPAFPLDDTSLDAEIADFAKENYADTTLPIYIVCNSGNKGAIRATAALKAAGIASERIFTVTGGAGELGKIEGALNTNRFDDAYDWGGFAIPADVAMAAYEAGDAKIVDVRKAEDYAKGHLAGSINVDLGTPTDANLQIAAKDTIEKNISKDDTVYLLCYSGNKCAKTAVSIMNDLGYDLSKVKIITGGANNNQFIKDEFITLPFTDVASTDWFAPYVESVFANGVMTGMNETTFGPTVKLSRAQFATMLWRLAGEPDVAYKATFPDVADGTWYTKAVLWANSQGIVTGYTHNGLFGSNDDITREQLATMLYRYARVMNYTTEAKAELSTFPDGAKVSEFAKAPVAWAVAEGIIKGNDADKTINPQGNAVRAEAATMFDRFVKYSYDAYQYAEPLAEKQVFVSAEYVKNVIDGVLPESENYVLAEVSWGAYASAKAYKTAHVPGAIHINSDTVEYDDCDPWPMGDGIDDLAQYDQDFNYGANEVLPIDNFNIRSAEQLTAMMKHFGITEDTTVILYGDSATNSAVTRVAFAMLYAGVDNVRVLNGGFEAWKAAGYATETTVNMPVATEEDFGVTIPEHPEYIMSIEDVKDNLENNENFNLVSIRSYAEFIGETSGYGYIDMAGEPAGAIWGKDTDDGTYAIDGKIVDADKLAQYIEEGGGSYDNELSFYCGTGWRATIPFLIAYEDGKEDISLFDGGWWQWTVKYKEAPESYPIQKITPEEAAK